MSSQHSTKLVGTLGIFAGVLCLLSFAVGDNSKLIIPISKVFLVKYFVVIALVNGGIMFIGLGFLTYVGFLVPYYSKDITDREIAKNNVLCIALLVPFWVSLFSTIFILAGSVFWKVLGGALFVYIAHLFSSGIKVIRNA